MRVQRRNPRVHKLAEVQVHIVKANIEVQVRVLREKVQARVLREKVQNVKKGRKIAKVPVAAAAQNKDLKGEEKTKNVKLMRKNLTLN